MISLRLKKKFIIYILVFLLLGCQSQQQDTEKSVFSWHKQEVLNGKDDFFNTLQSFNVQNVYQYFSSDLTDDQIDSFINECSQQDISVYYLCGTPEYALSENYTQLSQEIERAKYISELTNENNIKGIVLDIEPYLLDEFEDDAKSIMSEFYDNLKQAYTLAKSYDLKMIVCIPYYYDTQNLTSFLENLLKDGCDGIAIMNYYQSHEAQHIQTEIELCQKYQKECINIFELSAPEDGITEENTYYDEGISLAMEHFQMIQENYDEYKLSLCFHDYHYLKELLENE